MLITTTYWEHVLGILSLPFTVLLAFFVPSVFIAISVVLGLYILGELSGHKIIIDKLTKSITLKKQHFLLIYRERVVPFSIVRNVVIDYEPHTTASGPSGTTHHNAWKVSLDIGKKLKIDRTTNEANMFRLASEISKFIGRELVDNSAKLGNW